MRVIDPKTRKLPTKKKRHSKKPLLYLCLVFFVVLSFVAWHSTGDNPTTSQPSGGHPIKQNITQPVKSGKLKTFTGEQFKQLYNNFSYPNTAPINEHTPITGDEQADQRIKTIAVQRGYQLRSAPVTNAFVNVGEGFLLQQKAAQPWINLKAAAKKDGINLGLTAAYRSADEQRQIFVGRLAQTGIPTAGISYGGYDAQISQLLRMTAIPGYSRHHTGYTVDISCENQPTTSFEYTVCFKWLETDNYKNAKTYGWIPSYPEGTGNQGPDPEAWEYVWVGVDAVTE